MTKKLEFRSLIVVSGGILLILINILLNEPLLYLECNFMCALITIIFLIYLILPIISFGYFIKDKARFARKKLIIHSISILVSLAPIILTTTLSLVFGDFDDPRICGTYLSGLGKALTIYSYENNDLFPDTDKWCDILILHQEVGPKSLICRDSDAIAGESSYAMNANLSGKTYLDISNDTVVLFETDYGRYGKRNVPTKERFFYQEILKTEENKFLDRPDRKVYKDRWNQAGGPELLTAEHHNGEGAIILFNNGSVQFIEKEDFNDLNWGEDK